MWTKPIRTMTLDQIEKEFYKHAAYVNSFKIAPSAFSVAYYTPNGKRVTLNQKEGLIKKDAQKRAKKILEQ
jgi:hypothetical protein